MSLWREYEKAVPTLAAPIKDRAALEVAAGERRLVVQCRDGVLCPEAQGCKVKTQEGWVSIQYPFWLAIDEDGWPYPIAEGVFEASYVPIERETERQGGDYRA